MRVASPAAPELLCSIILFSASLTLFRQLNLHFSHDGELRLDLCREHSFFFLLPPYRTRFFRPFSGLPGRALAGC